jgi:hypothetical protein
MGGCVPAPLGLHMREHKDDGIAGTLRNVQKTIDSIGRAKSIELDFVNGGQNILKTLAEIYQSPSTPGVDDSNATDLVSERLAPNVESAFRRPQPTIGGGIRNPSLKVCLKDVNLSPDFSTLTVAGEAKATIEIPTDFPAQFDTPTEIGVKITSASLSPSQIGVVGRLNMARVFHGDLKLQVHLDDRRLLEAVALFAKQRNLTRSQVEDVLRSMSFDASMFVKAGFLPISFIKLSATSLLPMHRPLIGATDDLLPAQIASMPNRELLIVGGQVVPKGVFFDTFVPGLGAHYSNFGTGQGISGTVAGLAKPDLDHIGQVQAFGYADLHYARRVSNTVDLDFGMTYTYSPTSTASQTDALQLQYLHARSKSWLPPSQDNQPPAVDHSGHSFMFTIKGTFDKL